MLILVDTSADESCSGFAVTSTATSLATLAFRDYSIHKTMHNYLSIETIKFLYTLAASHRRLVVSEFSALQSLISAEASHLAP